MEVTLQPEMNMNYHLPKFPSSPNCCDLHRKGKILDFHVMCSLVHLLVSESLLERSLECFLSFSAYHRAGGVIRISEQRRIIKANQVLGNILL